MDIIDNLGIAAIPVIVVICFLIAEGVKATDLDNKWIPIICGVTGGLLGISAMFVMPDFPAHDILSAIAVGIVSGFAATGVHQAFKQLSEDSELDEYEAKHSVKTPNDTGGR